MWLGQRGEKAHIGKGSKITINNGNVQTCAESNSSTSVNAGVAEMEGEDAVVGVGASFGIKYRQQ